MCLEYRLLQNLSGAEEQKSWKSMPGEQLFRALPRKNTEETEKKEKFPHLPSPKCGRADDG